MSCPYDPTEMAGAPLGMFHCPECGCLVLAGVPHPVCAIDFCDYGEVIDYCIPSPTKDTP